MKLFQILFFTVLALHACAGQDATLLEESTAVAEPTVENTPVDDLNDQIASTRTEIAAMWSKLRANLEATRQNITATFSELLPTNTTPSTQQLSLLQSLGNASDLLLTTSDALSTRIYGALDNLQTTMVDGTERVSDLVSNTTANIAKNAFEGGSSKGALCATKSVPVVNSVTDKFFASLAGCGENELNNIRNAVASAAHIISLMSQALRDTTNLVTSCRSVALGVGFTDVTKRVADCLGSFKLRIITNSISVVVESAALSANISSKVLTIRERLAMCATTQLANAGMGSARALSGFLMCLVF